MPWQGSPSGRAAAAALLFETRFENKPYPATIGFWERSMRTGGEVVYVAFGANLGDREAAFAAAIEAIEKDPDLALVRASTALETNPIGPPGQDSYLNAVVELRVWIDPFELLARLHRIERLVGRDRRRETERWGPRRLDLDILIFGEQRIDSPQLVIPHPRAPERNFVMVPLAEIAPSLRHPLLGSRVAEIARSLPDPGSAHVWSNPSCWPSRTSGDPADPQR